MPEGVIRVLSGLLSIALIGCAGTVRETTRAATPEAIKGTLDTAHEPDNRQQIAEIVGDPQIGGGAARLSEAVTAGIMKGLMGGENGKLWQAQSREFAVQLGADLTRSVARELRPEIVAIVEQSVDRAMAHVLSDETQQRATAFTVALTRAFMEGVGQELAAVDLTTDSAKNGVAALARQVSRGAALGAQDAVRETKERTDAHGKRDGDILADAQQAVGKSADLLSTSTLVLVGILLVAIAALAWALLRSRRYRRAGEANQEAVRILTQAVQAEQDGPSMQALRERIEGLARGRAGAQVLSGIIREHPREPAEYPQH